MKGLGFVLGLLPIASLVAGCAGNAPPPPAEPKVVEVITDAGPPPVVDAAPPPQALYDRLGGKEGVATIIDSFSKNLLADPRVSKLFKKSKDNLTHFKDEFSAQLCHLAGGPCQYDGKSMHDAHQGMGINDAQFDAVVEDLKLALDEKGVAEQDKSELFAAIAPMRSEIVEKDKGEKKGKKK
ncbi:MAG TPA: group 1 truncated hemoglobin [Polyangiaceae bacterium]